MWPVPENIEITVTLFKVRTPGRWLSVQACGQRLSAAGRLKHEEALGPGPSWGVSVLLPLPGSIRDGLRWCPTARLCQISAPRMEGFTFTLQLWSMVFTLSHADSRCRPSV